MHSFLEFLAAAFAVVGGGTGIAAFLGIGPQRRLLGSSAHKTDTDAEVALSDGALRRISAAEERAEKAEQKADGAIAEMQKLRRKFFAYELWADQHLAWDDEAVTENHALGGHLRPPPQLVILKEG